MNYVTETVLDAIAAQRPNLASWCEDKRHELPDAGKLESLRWVCFELDARNREIAATALGVSASDLDPQGPLGRVLRAI